MVFVWATDPILKEEAGAVVSCGTGAGGGEVKGGADFS